MSAADPLFLGRWPALLAPCLSALALACSAGQCAAQGASLSDGLQRADAAHLAGRYSNEETLLRGLLKSAPAHGDAAIEIELRLAEAFDQDYNLSQEQAFAQQALTDAQANPASKALLARAEEAAAVALDNQKQYAAGEPLHHQALALAETLGPGGELTPTILDGLGRSLENQGRHADAEQALRRAWTMLQSNAPQSLETARSMLSLGTVLLDTQRYDEAETLLVQVVALRSALLPPHHVLIASARRMLGAALTDQKKYAEAETVARSALDDFDAALGPDAEPSEVAAQTLADTLEAEKRYGEAEALRRRVVATEQRAGRAGAIDGASAQVSLAVDLYNQQRLDEAAELYRPALIVYQKSKGEQDLGTAQVEIDLALILSDQHRAAEAEPLYRAALATRTAIGGANDLSTLTADALLAQNLDQQNKVAEAGALWTKDVDGRTAVQGLESPDTLAAVDGLTRFLTTHYDAAEAETLARSTLAIRERLDGPDSYEAGLSLGELADAMDVEGRFVEAADIARREVAIDAKIKGPDSDEAEADWHQLTASLYYAGDFDSSMDAAQHGLAIATKNHGENSLATAAQLDLLAGDLIGQGRMDEAFRAAERELAIDVHAYGMSGPEVAAALGTLARATQDAASTEAIRRQIILVDAAYYGDNSNNVGSDIAQLADALTNENKNAEAEKEYIESLSRDTFNQDTMIHLTDLAWLLNSEGRYADAEPYARRAVGLYQALIEQGEPNGWPAADLAMSLAGQKKYDEAEAQWRDVLKSDDPRLHARYGAYLLERDRPAEAVPVLREAVAALKKQEASVLRANGSFASAGNARTAAADLSLALSRWAKAGGGAAAGDHPDTLLREAFLSAQDAEKDSEGDVFAQAAARLSAGALGLTGVVTEREKLIQQRTSLQQRYAEQAGKSGASKTDIDALSHRLADLDAQVDALNAQLRERFPSYWALINPDPVPIDQVRAATGADPALLHADEALILFMAPPSDSETGLVFAVSREKTGWAAIDLTGEALRKQVAALRTDIDPFAYGVDSGARRAPPSANIFDRTASYALYQALLGAPSIQAVIADKATLLFVPSGPLNSLPPSLLVTAPPEGGRARDDDPQALRDTHWLLREKAVAVLPNVASLRLLRQVLPKARPQAMSPLLAFADPNFASESGPPPAPMQLPASFESKLVSREDRGKALADLEPLPGTKEEGEALRRALNAQPDSLLLGDKASRVELFRRNDDGELAQVRILSFSTHGLVAGDLGLAEPALVLSGDGQGHDGLLTASDTAALRLGADWVILSACNTASPDPRHTEGVSGLARAFFYAGARALIVSHWRVRDDVASRLIPDVVSRQRSGLSRAQAMRAASLAILDDKTLDAADPFSWAPFVVMGDPGD